MDLNTRRSRSILGIAGLALTMALAQGAQAEPPKHAPAHGYRDKKGAPPPKSSATKRRPTYQRTANDIDGDGIPNSRDRDMDGDGIVNTHDKDIDGDGIPNAKDRNPNLPDRYTTQNDKKGLKAPSTKDGFINNLKQKPGEHRDGKHDAKKHTRQGDIDKDGIANRKDKDLDGDGIRNKKDKDRDGDKVSNKKDDFDRRKNRK